LQTGEQAIQYDAGVGIVCMRLYKQLLFAGCYDGNIYVFNVNVSIASLYFESYDQHICISHI